MKKSIFLLAAATLLAAAACSDSSVGTACYTCTITTSAPNVDAVVTTSSFCDATEEFVRDFEQKRTTTSGSVTQTTTCKKQ